jgi:hypothetical protein
MASATDTSQSTNGSGPVAVDEPENPLHRLTPEQIEAIGKEFDELHEQVKADLGDRDARYIRSMIALQRRLALLGRVELIASRWRLPWHRPAHDHPARIPRRQAEAEARRLRRADASRQGRARRAEDRRRDLTDPPGPG